MRLWQLVLVSIVIAVPLTLLFEAWVGDIKSPDTPEQWPKQATIQTLDGKEWQIWYELEVGGHQDSVGADSRVWLQEDPRLTKAYFIYFHSSSGKMEFLVGSHGQWVFAECWRQAEEGGVRDGGNVTECLAEKSATEDFERDYPLFSHLARVTKDDPGSAEAEAQNILDQILALEQYSH